MNQQQLQIARAALWRQNATPILTYDDASAWLDNINFCLFLPRHTQLPAPGPSFVEACMGTVRAMPPADAIAPAMDLAIRLVGAGRAIPLNLLGTFSEQPDFLITPDVLPWVVAVRGDRQWKTAPTGRGIAPIVLRTWEALDQQGAQTAVEIRELLGRELTEAAVLRALIELWTTLRAAPAYTAGEPTRWSLLKDRYATQLATAANTAQPTALSALLSIYLRSAVAATGEEAEIFLSPLTARSRIRDVVHGMTAARQFGTMSVGTHTLLFVEGSLPEHLPETVPAPAPESVAGSAVEGAAESTPPASTPASPQQDRARREAIRKYSRDDDRAARPPRREFRPAATGAKPSGDKPTPRPFQKRAGDSAKSWQKRPAPFRSREDRPAFPRPPQAPGPESAAPESPGRPSFARPGTARTAAGRTGPGRPWQKDRPAGRPQREGRPAFPRRDKPFDRPRPSFGGKSAPRKFDRPRPAAPHEGGIRPPSRTASIGSDAPPQKFLRPGPGMPRFDAAERASRPSRPAAPRSGPGRSGPGRPSTGRPSSGRSGPSKFGPRKPSFTKPGFSKPGFSKSGPPRSGASRSGAPRSGPGKFGLAKFSAGPRNAGPRKPGKFDAAKFGPGKPRTSFGAAKRGPGDFAKRPRAGTGAKRTFRPGGPPRGGASSRPGAPPRKNFREPGAPPGKPRKNRSKDENSE